MAEVVVGELRNHATRRSGCRVFRTSLEARSEVEKKNSLRKMHSVVGIATRYGLDGSGIESR